MVCVWTLERYAGADEDHLPTRYQGAQRESLWASWHSYGRTQIDLSYDQNTIQHNSQSLDDRTSSGSHTRQWERIAPRKKKRLLFEFFWRQRVTLTGQINTEQRHSAKLMIFKTSFRIRTAEIGGLRNDRENDSIAYIIRKGARRNNTLPVWGTSRLRHRRRLRAQRNASTFSKYEAAYHLGPPPFLKSFCQA